MCNCWESSLTGGWAYRHLICFWGCWRKGLHLKQQRCAGFLCSLAEREKRRFGMCILNEGALSRFLMWATTHIIQAVHAYSLWSSLKLLAMFHPVMMQIFYKFLQILQERKRELGVSPSTGLKGINQVMQSKVSSDRDVMHGCKKNQDVKGRNVSEFCSCSKKPPDFKMKIIQFNCI